MAILNTAKLSLAKKICVYVGIGLLALSILLFSSMVLGFSELESYALFGQSGLRTLAGIAVAGCLCAAIGFFDE
tara:strand:- start:152 stop:373 length:222 start_codon:yes stop_codon:yes gene_type:complete